MTAVRVIRRLEDLLDVDGKGMSDGTTLVYRDDTAKHEYETVGGVGDSSLTDLTDVTGTPGTGKSPVSDGAGDFPLTHIVTQTDLDGVLSSVAAVDWRYLEPLNGFANLPNLFGDNWVPLRYRLTLNNIVHLEGLVKPPPQQSGSPIVICVMPEDCRSGYDLAFPAKSAIPDEEGHVYLRSDGRLELASARPWDWISLCGISWSVEAAQ